MQSDTKCGNKVALTEAAPPEHIIAKLCLEVEPITSHHNEATAQNLSMWQ